MVFWEFLVAIAFAALVFASITDIKTREVPNWVSYSLVVIGLGSRLIHSLIEWDFSFIFYGLLGFAVFFGFANIMYYTKQWGGGDAKLLMGLGAMFGNYGLNSFLGYSYSLPFLVVLLLNIFVGGLFYGIIYSIFLALKNKKKFIKEIRKTSFTGLKISASVIAVIFLVGLLMLDSFLAKIFSIVLVMAFVAIALMFFMKIIENASLYKIIDVKKLVEGDWLAQDVVVEGKVVCAVRNIGLTKEDIVSLKKSKVKSVLVREGIPFVPGFLLGFLATIIIGDFLIFVNI